MVAALGGPRRLIDQPDTWRTTAPHFVRWHRCAPVVVGAIDVRAIGLAVIALGGWGPHARRRHRSIMPSG